MVGVKILKEKTHANNGAWWRFVVKNALKVIALTVLGFVLALASNGGEGAHGVRSTRGQAHGVIKHTGSSLAFKPPGPTSVLICGPNPIARSCRF
jgi:hypothetical protein